MSEFYNPDLMTLTQPVLFPLVCLPLTGFIKRCQQGLKWDEISPQQHGAKFFKNYHKILKEMHLKWKIIFLNTLFCFRCFDFFRFLYKVCRGRSSFKKNSGNFRNIEILMGLVLRYWIGYPHWEIHPTLALVQHDKIMNETQTVSTRSSSESACSRCNKIWGKGTMPT